MGTLIGRTLLYLSAGILILFVLVHVIFALPLWLLAGGVVLAFWLRNRSRRHRLLTSGRGMLRYLGSGSRR